MGGAGGWASNGPGDIHQGMVSRGYWWIYHSCWLWERMVWIIPGNILLLLTLKFCMVLHLTSNCGSTFWWNFWHNQRLWFSLFHPLSYNALFGSWIFFRLNLFMPCFVCLFNMCISIWMMQEKWDEITEDIETVFGRGDEANKTT